MASRNAGLEVARRELLDHVIPLNEQHLRRLMRDYVSYYRVDRIHDSLGQGHTRRTLRLWLRPSLVRSGTLTGAIVDASTLALFAVRRGARLAGTWTTASPSSIALLALSDSDHALAYNPWSVNAARQRYTSGEVAVIARSAALGAADNAWQLNAYRRRGTTWTFDENISGATQIEPLLGVRLAPSRQTRSRRSS
jgi:hypothetical protein